MSAQDLIRGGVAASPTIYAYEHIGYPPHKGWLKVGYTTRTAQIRAKEQNRTSDIPYRVVLSRPAMRRDGSSFDDHTVHRILRRNRILNPEGEWFVCDAETVERAIAAAVEGRDDMTGRTRDFRMRPEQERAVEKTAAYFESFRRDPANLGLTPHFLWNAKMRFGKTFTAYRLALRMGWRKMLVLSFKPAVKTAWEEDLLTHKDFDGWQFCRKREDREFNRVDESRPFACFASFQDVLGRSAAGGIKATNGWIQTVDWDCIVLDEYHYGAWGRNARNYYDPKDPALRRAEEAGEIISEDADSLRELEAREMFDEGLMPLHTGAYLYLSGTPFRAISSGEFIEEQIFNWTYSDEQAAKESWQGPDNPYAQLPKMVMMTYRLPESISEIASQGEFDEFDLNEFFRAENDRFLHEEYVRKWLSLIRGAYTGDIVTQLKLGSRKPPMPFSDSLSRAERKELTEDEKEFKSRRREIQEKLIKFATRIPVFMYLTDYREYCLKDVIEQLEPELFRKVTGLSLKDFSLLVSLGVFNSELMNDAVYKFKRYEDASLEYTGIDKHGETAVGLWDTAVTKM